MVYRETKKRSLEEVAAAFGDKVVVVTEVDVVAEAKGIENEGRAGHMEQASPVRETTTL